MTLSIMSISCVSSRPSQTKQPASPASAETCFHDVRDLGRARSSSTLDISRLSTKTAWPTSEASASSNQHHQHQPGIVFGVPWLSCQDYSYCTVSMKSNSQASAASIMSISLVVFPKWSFCHVRIIRSTARSQLAWNSLAKRANMCINPSIASCFERPSQGDLPGNA